MLHPKIKNAARDVLMNMGLKNYLLKKSDTARMLLLHGIDDVGQTAYNSRFISSKNFDKLLLYFKKHFHIATLEDFCLGNYPKDQFTITITFDDGLANNYTHALPLLEKHNMPASFFITGIRKLNRTYLWPDFIDLFLYDKQKVTLQNITYTKNKNGIFISSYGVTLKALLKSWNFSKIDTAIDELIEKYQFDIDEFSSNYFLQMTEDEIYRMAQHPLCTIGSHGMTHADLTQMPIAEAEQEILESKTYLEEITKKEVTAFGFPFDIYSKELVDATKKAGYQFIVPYCLEKDKEISVQRFGINPYVSFSNQLYYIHKGYY